MFYARRRNYTTISDSKKPAKVKKSTEKSKLTSGAVTGYGSSDSKGDNEGNTVSVTSPTSPTVTDLNAFFGEKPKKKPKGKKLSTQENQKFEDLLGLDI